MAHVEKWPPLARDPRQRPRWRARWRDPDGTTQSKVFAKKVDAERHLTAVTHSTYSGAYVDPSAGKVTVSDYVTEWRDRQLWRPSTAAQVESYFRLHVTPTLGDYPLNALRPDDVQKWVKGLTDKLAPGSVELVYRHFSAAMLDAERNRVIGQSPCQQIKLPRKTKTEIVPPTVGQVDALADGIADRYRAAVILAAGAGLRLGEVFGVQVDRLDLDARTLRVDQQLHTPSNGPAHLGPPKTDASVRTVPLADVVVSELRKHLETFPPVDGYVFVTAMDQPVRRSTFQDAWARALKAADVGHVRFHDLRHHYASCLIAAGCSVKSVQKVLGHASASETLDTYSHLWPDDEDRTRAAVDAAWRESG